MKRILFIILVISLLVFCSLNASALDAAADTAFIDVAEDAWYYGDVYAAQALGLMEGVGEGRFSPDSSLTLAEAVTLAARARSLYLKDEEAFVRHDEWYRVYGDYALANSILKEEPADWTVPATRTVCAALFTAAMPPEGLEAINTVVDGAIPDVVSDAAVYTLYRAGVMVGDDAHRFHPNDPIRRCEIAAVVNRLLQPESRLSVTLTEQAESHELSPSSGHHDWEPVTEPVVDPTTEPGEDTANGDGEITMPYDLSHPEEFASGDVLFEDGSMLVKFKTPFAGTVSGPLKDAGVAKLDKLMDLEGAVWYTAYLSAGTDVHEAIDAVRAMDNVILAEYNFVYTAESTVADEGPISETVLENAQINDQWYINSVGIQSAWQFQRGYQSENFKPHMQNENPPEEGQPEEPEQPGNAETLSGGSSDVVVAVIDTGVDYTHEDLRTNMWHNPGEIQDNGIDDDGNGYVDDYFGIDIVAGHGSGNDDHGHGTHVAGIIAAVNNDRGVVGVAYNTRIMSVKAGQSSGFFTQSAIAAAVIYAANNGADVINMSFGGPSITVAVQDALAYAYTRCVLVAAAGNDGVGNNVPPCNPRHYTDQPTYPAALTYVLGVMSVNRSGGLSGFSNFDCIPFDNYEYEVYAPGEAMLSTIPGDRYANWNGTSMAAPMVSGVAALLRSEFTDRNTYPTKFIYGQLSGTGPLGPDGYHRIVNAYDALTILPQPDVETTEYRLFDTPGSVLDTAGKNTGDGVIDAGETVAIGFFLRNHWGMAKNVTVSVDALSPSGIPCPYLEILTESVNYGTVGTYSTKDAGQIMTDGVFTGWEDPFYLHITDDCPNDYIIALNVHVTAENALDPDDDTVYQSDKMYYFEVRRGTVLPQIISSDMTLTKENLYIIPNATTIQPDVTVTVEPGTRIQFWTDDPHDPYAEQYMASLIVKGTLLVNGTAEEPVEMFPSDLMSRYCVLIETQGRTELLYAKITNPFLGRTDYKNYSGDSGLNRFPVTYAEGCEFIRNYPDSAYSRRVLNGGQVLTEYCSSTGGCIGITYAKNCVFYKLDYTALTLGGAKIPIDYTFHIERADSCAFIDSVFRIDSIRYAEDCLFYGNNLDWETDSQYSSAASSYSVGNGGHFWHNAIINRLTDDNVDKWLRFIAPQGEGSYSFDGNYWGTTNPTLIGLQIVDYRDFTTLALVNEGEILTEAPETVWPFATKAGVLVDWEEASVIGNEAVTFYVEFNRDMDQSIPLRVCFGSYYPYADYEIEGQWVSARRWEGATTLTTLIEGGYQFLNISNGASVDGKKLYTDWGRFRFEIDNSSALALIMQGSADANGVTLSWTQDDFDTLMGYNVYRSTALNGQYTRLNHTVIPADTKTFFDPNVEPGMEYFYNFTVVKTDATESEPSGRISVTTYDSMAPTLTHSPVYQAFAGNSVTVSANVTDNVGVQNVKLYYRVTGENGWRTAEMSHLNDKYTAVITANYVTTTGLEYYIDAFDGISHTLRGSAAEPFIITVQNTVSDSDKGDINGNGRIDMLDALLLIQSINGRVNLSAEEFARADINGDGELSAFEALRILQYINGKISTVLFD